MACHHGLCAHNTIHGTCRWNKNPETCAYGRQQAERNELASEIVKLREEVQDWKQQAGEECEAKLRLREEVARLKEDCDSENLRLRGIICDLAAELSPDCPDIEAFADGHCDALPLLKQLIANNAYLGQVNDKLRDLLAHVRDCKTDGVHRVCDSCRQIIDKALREGSDGGTGARLSNVQYISS